MAEINLSETLLEAEKKAILKAVGAHETAKEQAYALGVSRATLYRLLKKHSIDRGVVNG